MECLRRRYAVTRIGLYLAFPPEGGGAFQYAQSMLSAVSALEPTRYEAVVAHARPEWGPIVAREAPHVHAVEVHAGKLDDAIGSMLRLGFPLAPWRWMSRFVHPLARSLLALRCDAWIFPAQDVLTYALPARTIGVVHDLMHRHEPQFPEVSRAGLYRRRERHYKRMCNATLGILVDSELGKRHVFDAYGVPPARIHVLPFTVPGYMTDDALRRAPLERNLPERYFFYPAQFWQHKNHLRLLEAFRSIVAQGDDVHLVLAGSPKNEYANVLRAIEALDLRDRVHMLGYVADREMPMLYANALALVMPTFFGPTNIPPLEAFAVGCPVAVSNIYAMPEQMGDAALLFDPTSVDDIASAMHRLASEPALRSRLSEAGMRHSLAWRKTDFDRRVAEILDTLMLA